MKHPSESGQILVLVLLVILVGLTIGLSIASRTISNLKNTAELDQSNRAFSAAEAGVERALNLLRSNPSACEDGVNDCSASIDGIDAKVVVDAIGGNTRAFGVNDMAKDEVLQASLEGYTGNQVEIYWGVASDKDDCLNRAAAAVVSVVYEQGGEYGLGKIALDACGDGLRNTNNNFESDGIEDDFTIPDGGLTVQDGSKQNDFAYRYRLDLNGPLVPSGATPLLVRVRLLYYGPKPIAINPVGAPLPNQGQQITSTAEVGGTQRTVKVIKTTPALPAIFDFALFNGSTGSLSK